MNQQRRFQLGLGSARSLPTRIQWLSVVLSSRFLSIYLASERSERDTLRSVQLRIVYIYILWYVQNFVLITRKEGGA